MKMTALAIIGAAIVTPVAAADYVQLPPPPIVVERPPPVVIAPSPPTVFIAPEPRCHTVRETKHDDILDTNDWVESEVCD